MWFDLSDCKIVKNDAVSLAMLQETQKRSSWKDRNSPSMHCDPRRNVTVSPSGMPSAVRGVAHGFSAARGVGKIPFRMLRSVSSIKGGYDMEDGLSKCLKLGVDILTYKQWQNVMGISTRPPSRENKSETIFFFKSRRGSTTLNVSVFFFSTR